MSDMNHYSPMIPPENKVQGRTIQAQSYQGQFNTGSYNDNNGYNQISMQQNRNNRNPFGMNRNNGSYQNKGNNFRESNVNDNLSKDINQNSDNPTDKLQLEMVDGTPIIKLGTDNQMEADPKYSNFFHKYEDDYVHIDSISEYDRRRGYRRKYCSDAAYPLVVVEEENEELGILLLDCYASSISELSAVTLYNYLNIVLDEQFNDIKEVYRGITIVELHHLNIIGDLIKKLGVMPRYYYKKDNKIEMWSGSNIPNNFEVLETLNIAVMQEKDMIKKYEALIEKVTCPQIVMVIQRIIEDEKIHEQLLLELQKKYGKEVS